MTGAFIIELDGKYVFLCGEGLDMISFGRGFRDLLNTAG